MGRLFPTDSGPPEIWTARLWEVGRSPQSKARGGEGGTLDHSLGGQGPVQGRGLTTTHIIETKADKSGRLVQLFLVFRPPWPGVAGVFGPMFPVFLSLFAVFPNPRAYATGALLPVLCFAFFSLFGLV